MTLARTSQDLVSKSNAGIIRNIEPKDDINAMVDAYGDIVQTTMTSG